MTDDASDLSLGELRTLDRGQFLQGALGAAAVGVGLSSLVDATAALGAPLPTRGGNLRLGVLNGSGKDDLDAQKLVGESANVRGVAIFENLLYPEPLRGRAGWRPVPHLATVEPSRTFKVWQITLKSGITWHDGKTLTADDVVYSLQRAIGGDFPVATYIKKANIVSIKKVNVRTVTVTLKRAQVDFNEPLDFILPIVQDGTTDFSKPIGTGPFKFVEWKPLQYTKMVRNENYWRSGRPYLDQLEIFEFTDSQALLNALLANQVDAIADVRPEQARVGRSRGLKVSEAPSSLGQGIFMQLDRAPFSDISVRQALRLSINRPEMIAKVLLGYGGVGNDLWGKGWPDYNDKIPQRRYDPGQARKLLKRAGKDGLTVTLLTSPTYLPASTLYSQHAKAAGITIKLKQVPDAQYYSTRYYTKVPFQHTEYRSPFHAQVPQSMLPNPIYPETHFNDRKWQQAFFKAQSTLNEASRLAQYRALQWPLWRGDSGYLVWGFRNILDLMKPNVNGVRKSGRGPMGYYDFSGVWMG